VAGVGVVDDEVGCGPAGSIDEQPDRFAFEERVERAAPIPLRCGEGRHGPRRLPRNAQQLPAGGEDLQAGAGAQQRVGEHGAGADEVLAVVEHQQKPSSRQVPGQ
jgi:hypothetical protein